MALPTSPFCVWYYRRKHWFANNVLGLAFRCVCVWRVGWLVYPFFVVMVVGREGQNVLIQELGLKQVTRQGHSLQLSHIRGPLQGIQRAAAGLAAAFSRLCWRRPQGREMASQCYARRGANRRLAGSSSPRRPACPAACKASSTCRWARCRTASSCSAASSSTVRVCSRLPVC